MPVSKKPKIVIVGRPNVGKSSIFNRIMGTRKAIVESASGTTRDRLHKDMVRKGKSFTLVDTGGFEPVSAQDIPRLILKQLNVAIAEADVIFFVTDSTSGVTAQDRELAEKLRKVSKPIYLIVNKADNESRIQNASEFYELGLGEPRAVSAANGTGIDELLDDAVSELEAVSRTPAKPVIRVAIVGRPNVGKSSYVNSLLDSERVIVHHVAGTTRDAIDIDFDYNDTSFVLIDTAGIRHNTKIKESADFYGGVRSKEAISRADTAIVMIDGFDGLREDDRRIISAILDEGKAVIVAVNKWDLTTAMDMPKYKEMLIESMSAIKNVTVIFMSCKTGRNVTSSLDAVKSLFERHHSTLAPEDLKAILALINELPELRNKYIKFRYLRQKASAPPLFVLGSTNFKLPSENMRRYIENFFRKLPHDFTGVPIRIVYER